MRRRLFLTLPAAAALAACTVSDRGGAPDDPEPPTSPAPESSAPPEPRPRTVRRPTVLAVKIDNVRAARPHTGLREATVIHVEQVESGLTRLLAVYSGGGLPQSIGPVRSARETDLELLRQYGKPVLAFSGAQGKLLPLIDKAQLYPRSPAEAPGAYFRSPSRQIPHNLYLRPSRLDPAPDKEAKPADLGLRFGGAPSGGRATGEHTVRFPAARYGFTWSAARDRWRVSMDGTRTNLTPSTVVVQYGVVRDSRFRDRWGNVSPYTETVGEGEALMLRDGRAHTGRWSRESAEEATVYTDADGKPLLFADGQVWILHVRRR
ncbi:DUF3048 domain-containing protein [Streptomyces sp. TRM66268-LWL]|uniref:DUF3048 domain-containing protein n=1 Tax=Streptomyces polyasparticus TaxID=2767826 RepID=A0ABR7SFQ9_9ACTN|nr:DUF3048 domain-containing protein [Streptomyces polyasparticus]MBC9713575.1 DUF3048 domain-containing protein [Streptomyces polyasparticus]